MPPCAPSGLSPPPVATTDSVSRHQHLHSPFAAPWRVTGCQPNSPQFLTDAAPNGTYTRRWNHVTADSGGLWHDASPQLWRFTRRNAWHHSRPRTRPIYSPVFRPPLRIGPTNDTRASKSGSSGFIIPLLATTRAGGRGGKCRTNQPAGGLQKIARSWLLLKQRQTCNAVLWCAPNCVDGGNCKNPLRRDVQGMKKRQGLAVERHVQQALSRTRSQLSGPCASSISDHSKSRSSFQIATLRQSSPSKLLLS